MPVNKNYKSYAPFKLWTIENFPFIEEDFDAITNYQLWCRVVENLKKVIENQNQLQESQNYVLTYFNNLDVQDEIDTKLDEMAESGELTDIIAQYLGLAGVLAFNTISDLSDAQNIVNGSTCYTLGKDTYNDGKCGFYKIRTVTSDDTIDGFNIVALDISNTLIGERIPNYYINDINDEILNVKSRLTDLEKNENKFYQTRHQIGTIEQSAGVFKPLYAKIINVGTGSNEHTSWTNLVEVDEDVDVIYEIKGVVFAAEHSTTPIPRYENDNYYMLFKQDGDYIQYKNKGYVNEYMRILVEYTLQ